jgi:hypothetical protein
MEHFCGKTTCKSAKTCMKRTSESPRLGGRGERMNKPDNSRLTSRGQWIRKLTSLNERQQRRVQRPALSRVVYTISRRKVKTDEPNRLQICYVIVVREDPASYCHSEQMVMRRGIRVVAGCVEFHAVIAGETSTRGPTRSPSQRNRGLVGDLVEVALEVLMVYFEWRLGEMGLVGVIGHHSHLLRMSVGWRLEIGFVWLL